MAYSHLKSGTDIRGFASDLGGNEIQLTNKCIYDISAAFVVWSVNKLSKASSDLKISLGHDSRITAERICKNVKSALINAGVTVIDCGLSSTPAMFMTTIDLDCDAAIQITASHHPFDRNGLKFFLKSGGLEGSQIKEILDLANDETEIISEVKGKIVEKAYMQDYAKHLRDMIINAAGKGDKPLKDYHIVVDAGNGAGGFYATEVLEPLGADISGSQFLKPDGMFPNHIPNPENKEAMESICNAVKRYKAELGVIFDTDVDRAGCVDSSGVEINRNRLVALASYIALKDSKNATVVTDSVTSDGLREYIENHLGGKHYRYRRGYKNVIDKAIELCEEGINTPLAIETSGHAALKENYFLDDGAYLVTKIIIELAKGIDLNEVLKPLKMPLEERELRINIKTENFKEYGENVIKELEKFVLNNPNYKIADDNREGLRVSDKNGWFLLRLSVHDPVMPLNLESDVVGGIDKNLEILYPFFESFEFLEFKK